MKVQNIHYRTMGRCFRVTAMFTSDDAANRYMQDHPHEGVIASIGRQVLIADVRDEGRRVPYPAPPAAHDTCEICGNTQPSCWPVAINGDDQNIRMLCDGCAAVDLDAAWVIDLLEQDQRKN